MSSTAPKRRADLLKTMAICAAWSRLSPYLSASKPRSSAFCSVRNVLRLFSVLCGLPSPLLTSACATQAFQQEQVNH